MRSDLISRITQSEMVKALRHIAQMRRPVVLLILCADEAMRDSLSQEINNRPDCAMYPPQTELVDKDRISLIGQVVEQNHNNFTQHSAVFVVTKEQLQQYQNTMTEYRFVITRTSCVEIIS